MLQPKFKIGDKVSHKPDLYGNTKSKIVEIEKIFKEINSDGTFDNDGLSILESDIKNIAIKHDFDGETLIIYFPETNYGSFVQKASKRVSKFHGLAYTATNKDMNTIYGERELKLII